MVNPIKRWVANRVLDEETVQSIAPESWKQWRNTTDAYRGIGYGSGKKPPQTGDLLVQSPYADWYNLTWGLAPPTDMPKWRWMYRARSEIRRGIDTRVILAVGRGLKIVCEDDEEIEKFVNELLYKLNIRDILQSAVTDMLVYGTGYFEKIRVAGDEQEGEKVVPNVEVKASWTSERIDNMDKDTYKAWIRDYEQVGAWMAQNKPPPKKENGNGDLVELKALDPLWMRVNRDAFGNILGYVQWGLTPIPQSVTADKLVVLKWMPKSWAHENAYGTSILMPVQRHVSFLIQAEEDMKLWFHQYGKPMLVTFAGTEEKPYPAPKISYLVNALSARQPGTDVVLPGDCKLEMIQGGAGQTTGVFKDWASYNREKIYESLGIPSVLMNLPGDTSRATSDISLQAFIADEQMIQEVSGEQLMKQLIEPEVIKKFNRLPPMKTVWAPILIDDRNKISDRVLKAVGEPIMSVNEGRSELGLPPRPEPEYDEIPELPAPGFGQLSKPEGSESQRTGPREEQKQKVDKGQADYQK